MSACVRGGLEGRSLVLIFRISDLDFLDHLLDVRAAALDLLDDLLDLLAGAIFLVDLLAATTRHQVLLLGRGTGLLVLQLATLLSLGGLGELLLALLVLAHGSLTTSAIPTTGE